MDMIKIGKFIQLKRKEQNLTQMDLAEKLNITDRAISKWECGKAMPDPSIMLELPDILNISVNELLTGEDLEMTNYNKQVELNLIELKKQKEDSDKRLLAMEIVIGFIVTMFLVSLVFIAALCKENNIELKEVRCPRLQAIRANRGNQQILRQNEPLKFGISCFLCRAGKERSEIRW